MELPNILKRWWAQTRLLFEQYAVLLTSTLITQKTSILVFFFYYTHYCSTNFLDGLQCWTVPEETAVFSSKFPHTPPFLSYCIVPTCKIKAKTKYFKLQNNLTISIIASGPLSSCSAKALLIACTESSFKCFERSVLDGCSKYSGSPA